MFLREKLLGEIRCLSSLIRCKGWLDQPLFVLGGMSVCLKHKKPLNHSALFNPLPLAWLAANFSLHYHRWIKRSDHEKTGNYFQLEKLLIVTQILFVIIRGNVERIARGIWLLMLECKGLIASHNQFTDVQALSENGRKNRALKRLRFPWQLRPPCSVTV